MVLLLNCSSFRMSFSIDMLLFLVCVCVYVFYMCLCVFVCFFVFLFYYYYGLCLVQINEWIGLDYLVHLRSDDKHRGGICPLSHS